MPFAVTGSRVPLVMACPTAAALPCVEDDNPSAPRDRGIVIHRFLQRCSEIGHDASLVEITKTVDAASLAMLAAIQVEALPTHLAPEVALAWDWHARTARELGRGIGRAYTGLGPTEIPMTLDLAGFDPGARRVYVGDYKSGYQYLPSPRSHGQVMLGALALATLHNADAATVSLIRVNEHDEPTHLVDDVDRWDLDTFADAIEAAMDRIGEAHRLLAAGGTPDVRMGPQCRYCPARKACPAQVSMIRQVTSGSIVPGDLVEPAQVIKAHLLLEQAEALVQQLRSEIYGYVSHDPVSLPDGRMLGVTAKDKEYVRGNQAHPIVLRELGADVAREAFDHKTSKSAIKKAISKRIHLITRPDGKKAKVSTKAGDGVFDLALIALRSSGATITKTSYPLGRWPADKIHRGPLPAKAIAEPDSDDEES